MRKYLDIEWLRNEIEINERTYEELAEEFGVHYNTIANRARANGITHPNNLQSVKRESANKLLRNRDWLYEQYITLNKSYTDIGKEFSMLPSNISRWSIRHGFKKPLADRLKHGSPKVSVECSQCNTEFKVKPHVLKNGQGRFCSQHCSATHHYYGGVGEKMHRGCGEYYKTPRGKAIAIENGKRASKLLANGYKTSIEVALESELTRRGIEFEEQKTYKLGIADVFIEPNIYVFADGDYWHAYNAVQGNAEPTEKQAKQIAKDRQQTNYLKACGNVVFRFWEHEINTDIEACVDVVLAEINEKAAI